MSHFYMKNFVKNASSKIAAYTKFVHLMLYAMIYLGMISMCWSFTKDPIPFFRIIVLGTLINFSVGIMFWLLPSFIIKWKKKRGKNWNGLLTILNLFLFRFIAWPAFAFMVFFIILGLCLRAVDSKTVLFKQVEASALQGEKIAQYGMGVFYSLGQEGVSKDYKKATEWYQRSADQGLPQAQTRLGIAYREGRGVPKNYKEANKWLLLAANQGEKKAQTALGSQYYYGCGVEKDLIEAFKWYTLACDNGDKSSIHRLEELEKVLSSQKRTLANKRIEAWKKDHAQ